MISIERDKVVGRGVTLFTPSSITNAEIVMPSPVQDFLETTVGSNCNATWTITGSTDLLIKGRELGKNCKVVVDSKGENLAEGTGILTLTIGTLLIVLCWCAI